MIETTTRDDGLRQLLCDRRREMQDEVQNRIRHGRADRPYEVYDDLEHSEADIQGDMELALLQMKRETLARIEEALVRLDAGDYGSCIACAGEIAERRLRALPFAVRCQTCEERREAEQRRTQRIAGQRGVHALPGNRQRLRTAARLARAHPARGQRRYPSSAARIFRSSVSDVNGLWRNAIPGLRIPWCAMASSVYPDM